MRARVATRPTAMRARASALLARATLFAFALLAPTPAACHGFYEPGDEALPESVLLESHDVAYPRDVGTFSLADFDHTRNSDGKKFVTVVATFYTGCTPGRQDYPSLTRVVTQLHAQTAGGHLPGNVAFVASLKNGVHAGVAEAWANLPGADVSVAGNNSGFPYLVDDRHRALVYKFFDAAIHPAYAVIDHCMRFRRLLPALTRQESGDRLEDVVEALLRETTTACPANLRRAAEIRPRRSVPAFVPGAAPSTGACVPAFGADRTIRRVDFGVEAAFANPRTLAFHPNTGDLYVGNSATDSMTIVRGASATGARSVSRRFDRARYHYNDNVAAAAFGAGGSVATCQESENDYEGMKRPNRFMGPSLYDTEVKVGTHAVDGGWPAGKNVYVDAAGNGCDPDEDPTSSDDSSPTCFWTHTDMLHATPNCMGIAHDPEPDTPYNNVFWVFDGLNSTLVRYDFEQPHGPGSLDHSLANVRRFPEISLTRVPGVPGHVVVDPETRTVFVADTGGGRIVAVGADSGRFASHARVDLGGDFQLWSSPEPSFEYSLFGCAAHKTFADGIDKPSGLALHGNALLVGEHGTGKIIALHRTTGARLGEIQTGASKLFGVAAHPATGDVWFADGDETRTLGVVERARTCDGSIPNGPAMTWPSGSSSESGEDYCGAERVELGVAVHSVEHDDGYLNMDPLGPAYGASDACDACADECDNDMLLMSGFLCHKCLPDNCAGGVYDTSAGTCENIIGRGYSCACEEGAYGDHCQHRATVSSGSHVSARLAIVAALVAAFR